MAIIYLSLRCHYQNDSCIRMGHFNVSLITVRDSHKTVSTDHFSRERTAEAELSPGLSAYQPNALPLNRLTHFPPKLYAAFLYRTCRIFIPHMPHLGMGEGAFISAAET